MKKKRGLLFLIPVVLGAFLYMFVDMLKAVAESHGIMLDVKILLPWISAIGSVSYTHLTLPTICSV